MKKTNTAISDWLDKYGEYEIGEQVEREIESINFIESLQTRIKKHCNVNNLKFEKYVDDGFVASRLISVRAGMETNIYTGSMISIPIKEIGNKRVYRKYVCCLDGDIVDDGVYDK
jgi:hypothetical protein